MRHAALFACEVVANTVTCVLCVMSACRGALWNIASKLAVLAAFLQVPDALNMLLYS